jgi:hypothetical protein
LNKSPSCWSQQLLASLELLKYEYYLENEFLLYAYTVNADFFFQPAKTFLFVHIFKLRLTNGKCLNHLLPRFLVLFQRWMGFCLCPWVFPVSSSPTLSGSPLEERRESRTILWARAAITSQVRTLSGPNNRSFTATSP